ncbi:ABC transporter permease [Caproicibacter sp. BJN0012]|uniref:ABC transporter permease n=1 Tax=Caproicibacter sp. BJN0012 TaxID=3110227 RepID=UPI002E15AAD3
MTAHKTMASKETFKSPTFANRLNSMLKLDFYRLFHTPVFYIMLLIAAIIPAMVLGMSGADASGADVGNTIQAAPTIIYTNTWQLIESTGGSAAAANPLDFGGYANINMVFIFAGLLMAIFVAHDYSSGFVKNIFTVHSKKIDYVISKSAVGIFGGAGMIITYLLGTVIAGLITGKAFDVNLGGLIMCLISKIFLMGIFCALFLGVAVFFRDKLWLTIVFTFLFGMMFYPAASVATLNSTGITVLASLMAGIIGAVAIGAVSAFILKKRDLV